MIARRENLVAEKVVEPAPVLDEDETRGLKERGYEILQGLGEGNTREVFLSKYSSGGANRLRVLKIPKNDLPLDSICTLINKSKRDVDKVEVDISNRIQHPNIVEIVDSFDLNGKTVNAEAYYEGTDLETRIKTGGAFTDKERTLHVFKQIANGMVYLNEDEYILHRDLKPSNIIITRSGEVKISDLQNAARKRDIDSVSMPTRGGTQHTHPSLLNSLVTGDPSRASSRTEVYSFGTTLWYALTGENAFDYRIGIDSNGKPIEVDGQTYRVRLVDGENILEKISPEVHEKRLKKGLKKLPREWRRLAYRCLTLNPKKEIRSMYSVKGELSKVNSGLSGKIREGFGRVMKYGIPVLVGGVIAGGIAGVIITDSGREEKPRLSDILRRQDYINFNLDNLETYNQDHMYDVLVPYMKKAKGKVPGINERGENGIKWKVMHSKTVHFLPPRLVSSWLRACYMHKDNLKDYQKDGEDRLESSFVPKLFFIKNQSFGRPNFADSNCRVALGAQYLKQCFSPKTNVADVLATYFTSDVQDLHYAKVKAESVDYFSKTMVHKEGYAGWIKEGYGQNLPYHQKELINTALALYMITDEQGAINWDSVPKKFGKVWMVPDLSNPGKYTRPVPKIDPNVVRGEIDNPETLMYVPNINKNTK